MSRLDREFTPRGESGTFISALCTGRSVVRGKTASCRSIKRILIRSKSNPCGALAIGRPRPCLKQLFPSRLLKKTHMPTACFKQAFVKVAFNRPGRFSRSMQSRSNGLPKYASARRFFARLASEIFLTSLQTDLFNNLPE